MAGLGHGKAVELGWRETVLYAAPAFAYALPTVPATVHLPSLHMNELGVAAIGTTLFLARFADMVLDPVIGWLGDHFGRRKLLIGLGALLCGLGCWRLFVSQLPLDSLSFAFWSVLLFVGWTAVSIHYTAWGNEIATSYDRRTGINGAREGMTLVGIFVAVALPAYLVGAGWHNRDAIAQVVGIALFGGAVATAIALWFVRSPRSSLNLDKTSLRGILSNGLFRRLLAVSVVNGIANALPAALFPVFVMQGLGGSEADAAYCLLIYFGAGIAGVPIWLRLSRQIGRHRAWSIAMAFAALVFAVVPWLPFGAIGPFMAICLLSGLALGADLVIPAALQGDVADFDQFRSRQRRAGLLLALWAMAQKFAQACAIGLGFGFLAMAGLDGSAAAPESTTKIALIYSGLPVVFKLMAAAAIWSFPLNATRLAAIRKRIERAFTAC